MMKSLPSKLMLKQRLFSLCMSESMPLREHLDQLNKILLDLRNVDEKVSDEDAVLILLVFPPFSYENFLHSFIVGKETVSMEELRSLLHNWELRNNAVGSSSGTDNQASGLMANRSKDGKKGKKKKRQKSTSKLPKDVSAYCKEKDYWKNECTKRKKQ